MRSFAAAISAPACRLGQGGWLQTEISMSTENLSRETQALLPELGVDRAALSGDLAVHSPIDGAAIGSVRRVLRRRSRPDDRNRPFWPGARCQRRAGAS